MDLRVCIISDYRQEFESLLKNLSLNADCKKTIKIGNKDYILEFDMSFKYDKYDYILIINKAIKNVKISAKRVIALQQEPFIQASKKYLIPFKNEWAIKKETYKDCNLVFAFNEGLFECETLINHNPKTFLYNETIFIKYPPMMYFLFGNISYKDLFKASPLNKEKLISCIASFDKRAFAGHIDRMKFVKALHKSRLGKLIDFYGHKTKYSLEEKRYGILPYKYTIAIENNVQSDYFSEKIMDAFLGYSIPIYFGANNIAQYFPPNSFVQIDIYNLEASIKKIENAINSNFYENNFEAVLEARRRVLEDYCMLNAVSKEILKDYLLNGDSKIREISLKAYKRSLKDKLKYYFLIIYYFGLRIFTDSESRSRFKDLQ